MAPREDSFTSKPGTPRERCEGLEQLTDAKAKDKGHNETLPEMPSPESYRFIPLTKGEIAVVDAADFEWLSQYRWYSARQGRGKRECAMRAERKANGRLRYFAMQNEIMKPRRGYVVDHRNGDTLDNRRCNLRNVTPDKNALNKGLDRRNK